MKVSELSDIDVRMLIECALAWRGADVREAAIQLGMIAFGDPVRAKDEREIALSRLRDACDIIKEKLLE